MKKFVMAAFCTLTLAGMVMAKQFTMRITKINDDGTVTGNKWQGGGRGDGYSKVDVTFKIAKDVQVYRGKFDREVKGLVKDGIDLALPGLMAAYDRANKVDISIGGTTLTDKDTLEIAIKDGKPAAKLNGKDIDINSVAWIGKAPLEMHVTTADDGVVTQILITTLGGGKGK